MAYIWQNVFCMHVSLCVPSRCLVPRHTSVERLEKASGPLELATVEVLESNMGPLQEQLVFSLPVISFLS